MEFKIVLISDIEIENILNALKLILDVIVIPEYVASGCNRCKVNLERSRN